MPLATEPGSMSVNKVRTWQIIQFWLKRKPGSTPLPLTQACLSPNLSSPKFPQPIFFPTLKFGPTISTPLWLEEVVDRLLPPWLCLLGLDTLLCSTPLRSCDIIERKQSPQVNQALITEPASLVRVSADGRGDVRVYCSDCTAELPRPVFQLPQMTDS